MKEETFHEHIERIKEDAKRQGLTDEELASMFLDGMFGKGKMTNSPKTMKVAQVAYYRGMMRGVRTVKEAEVLYVLRNGEMEEVDTESLSYKLDQAKKIMDEVCDYFGIYNHENYTYENYSDKVWGLDLEAWVQSDEYVKVKIDVLIPLSIKKEDIIRKEDYTLVIERGECCAGDTLYLLNTKLERKS